MEKSKSKEDRALRKMRAGLMAGQTGEGPRGWNHLPVGHPDNPKPYPICGARRRGEGGGICTLKAGFGTTHPGLGRCKYHGGASLVGADNPNFKTGRYSKAMKASLKKHYEDANEAGELDDLAPELGVQRMLLHIAIEKLGVALMVELGAEEEEIEKAEMALIAGEGEMTPEEISLRKKYAKSSGDVAEWMNVVKGMANDIVRTVTKVQEVKRKQMVTVAELKYLRTVMESLIETYLPDAKTREAFVKELAQFLPG